ncbi:MAG: hypothetical protein OQL09_00780, partial [Gammaproteobacteria bacterium]|nr:hypothetical protein [Gammaproteobacteria bacterium]
MNFIRNQPSAIIGLSLLLLPLLISAGPREDGLKAYKQGHYLEAIKHWLPLAEQGDLQVQYNLGIMYSKGQGIDQ